MKTTGGHRTSTASLRLPGESIAVTFSPDMTSIPELDQTPCLQARSWHSTAPPTPTCTCLKSQLPQDPVAGLILSLFQQAG